MSNNTVDLTGVGFLIAEAEARMKQFPQYNGFFTGWRKGTVKKDIVSRKVGMMARKGDLVIVKPEIHDVSKVTFAKRKDNRFVTVFNFRTNHNTSFPLKDIDVDFADFPTVIEQ